MNDSEMAARLQYTLVDPSASRADFTRHVEACAEYRFHAAMVPMCWVPLARTILQGTGVRVATFFGIGMGHESLAAKCMLLRECWALGADEVDYQNMINVLDVLQQLDITKVGLATEAVAANP